MKKANLTVSDVLSILDIETLPTLMRLRLEHLLAARKVLAPCGWRYCPRCGGVVDMVTLIEDEEYRARAERLGAPVEGMKTPCIVVSHRETKENVRPKSYALKAGERIPSEHCVLMIPFESEQWTAHLPDRDDLKV